VNDSIKGEETEVKCSKCDREFKHETIERFLEEEEERDLLDNFKHLWNPPKEGKFVCKCILYCSFIFCCVFFVFLFISSYR
jgi:hypothetical protein